MKKNKILYLISSLDIGGAETALVEFCNFSRTKGLDVSIFSLTPVNKKFIGRFFSDIEIKDFNFKNKYLLVFNFLFLIYRIFVLRPDIVHSHMIHANLVARSVRVFFPKTVFVNTAHSISEGKLSFLYKATKALSDLDIHISEAGLNLYLEKGFFSLRKSLYIPNGVPMYETNDTKFDTNKFISLGRLVKLKNHKFMIDSFSEAHSKNNNISLYIYGDGELKFSLEKYVNSINAGDYIHICGAIDNVSSELSTSFSFLLSSDYEGMPMSLLEAISFGLIPITTDVGSCSSVLAGLPNSKCLKVGDKDGYVKSILEVSELNIKEKETSRKTIKDLCLKRFSVENTFNQTLDAYNRVFYEKKGSYFN